MYFEVCLATTEFRPKIQRQPPFVWLSTVGDERISIVSEKRNVVFHFYGCKVCP
jgi:hypothetical protein